MLSKQELRRAERSRLQHTLDDAQTPHRTRALNAKLATLLRRLAPVAANGANGASWAAFQPIGFEPNIRAVFEEFPQTRWAFPRISGESLEFYSSAATHANHFEILEPDADPAARVALEDLRGLLIPGVAFDSRGGRLGRGAGYYDRALGLLKTLNPEAIKIGVAFAHQVHPEPLPLEPHDIPMDWIVTDAAVFSTSPTRGSSHE